MDKYFSQQAVKERIPHTWPLFFARHGRFTPIQQQAIPPILDGRDALIIAATASGKTEAVIAPLLERLWQRLKQPGLSILYICPTRALVRDLYERLRPILDDTSITIGMKTGDVASPLQLPAILITTPESTDSLLTRTPRQFINVQAIVLDEIHLFDNTPRGDHLRCLLPRIDHIRQYAQPEGGVAQRAALSATVPDPDGVVRRYLQNGLIISIGSGRPIRAEIRPFYDLSVLVEALSQRTAYKSLIFCNSRAEVEQTAVYLRQQLSRHAQIFVHYGNLDASVRRDVEERFSAATVAACVCTSTLELGVDIGSVDDVILLGAPPDPTSFLQRVGRGSRRKQETAVLCMPKSPGEWARFEALLLLASGEFVLPAPPAYAFRPSVLIQQIFSIIKQSPTGGVRLADLRRISPPEVTEEDIRKIFTELSFANYLQPGRLGEWRPAAKLQELLDKHAFYTNIGLGEMEITAVDARTGQSIAQTDRIYPVGTILLYGGKPMAVAWVEKYRFGLVAAPGQLASEILPAKLSYAAIPMAVSQAVAHLLGLKEGEMPLLPQALGAFLFHFWGTVWGELLTAVLIAHGTGAEAVNEYCLYLHQPLSQLPPLQEKVMLKAGRRTAVKLADRMEMGRYHDLLPADVAANAAITLLDLPQFNHAWRAVRLVQEPSLQESLHELIS